MKKYIYIIIITMLASSCNELELKPLDRISEADTWNDPALIQLYVNASYNALRTGFEQELLAAACDETFCIHNYGSLSVIQRGELTQDNVSNVSSKVNFWNFAYSNIHNLNVFFSKIDAAQGAQGFIDGLNGEMKFIRAYLYANLIWRYSGVPLITQVFGLNDDFKVSVSSYDDCVDFIVKELNEAALLLPDDQPANQKGRVSAHACMALKARVLLYSASLLNNPDHNQEKWQAAAAASEDLLNAGYELNDDYQGTFLTDNKEVIFAKYYTQSNATNFNQLQGRNGSNGFTAQNPSQNMVNAYEMAATGKLPYIEQNDGTFVLDPSSGYDPNNPYEGRDPRFNASILHDGSVWADRVTETFHGGLDSPESSTSGFNASLTSYAYKKFLVESIPPAGSSQRPTNPWIFFRFGEVLLNYAEAKFELGDEVTARQYLNLVRSRSSVNMPPVSDTGEDLRKRIQNERRVELAFEEHRFFDVRRWKIADVSENKPLLRMDITKQPSGSKTYQINQLIDREFLPQHYLMPIPRAEIDKSLGSLQQMPNY